MKVLFAVSNESISDSIIKKYQQQYREIISSKNVYYFNAIAKELQKDKSYDRIVISEDLEPFANNNYEIIDKFIFEKLDNISDEATSNSGQDIPIILICTDRREKSEALLIKIFGIGIYSALLGQDRSVSNVCELINKPRSKKDAKIYYHIESEDVDYKTEGEGDVSEIEIQNILSHYKRLGKNEEQYVSSFDNIATQYTDAQLRVICKFLPLNVKAVLEAGSQKYQELITFGTVTPSASVREGRTKQDKHVPNNEYRSQRNKKVKVQEVDQQLDVIERNIGKSNLTKPVVIPSTRDIQNVKKANLSNMIEDDNNINKAFEDAILDLKNPVQEQNDILETTVKPKHMIEPDNVLVDDNLREEPKKKRGRPRKIQPEVNTVNERLPDVFQNNVQTNSSEIETPKRRRGRPRKIQPEVNTINGRLPGVENVATSHEEANEVNLFDLGNESDNDSVITPTQPTRGIILPGFDEEEKVDTPIVEQSEVSRNYTSQSSMLGQNFKQWENNENSLAQEKVNDSYQNYNFGNARKDIESIRQYQDINLDNLLTKDKKVISFVGTSKNGTSFLVNNLADTLSKRGIHTAILDLTKNKNSYYIYTQNEEDLRKRASSCIRNLRNGIADGIQVSRNLTVFTSVPEENEDLEDYQNILTTLVKSYSIVLMDCDFDTNYGYFKNAQEIYLVQSFDILTIQPLTAFLRDLKTKNILNPEKLRIVLNKVLRVRSITERTIIGGMAFYNDPAMSFMTELFNKDSIKYCSIPFEEQTYSRYLEGLVNCQINTNGYSKNFMMSLENLSNMVYPLLSSGDRSSGRLNSYSSNSFSSNMNETLNRMKSNY